MKKQLALLALSFAIAATHAAAVIYSSADRDTTDATTLTPIQPTGSWFFGAHEDNGPGTAKLNSYKPIWHAGTYFTPSDDKNLGLVSIPLRARVLTGIRLEVYDTANSTSFANWTYLGQDVINALATGKQWFDFDLSAANILLESGTQYAFNIVVDQVHGRGTAQSFDWLGSYGFTTTPSYESYYWGPAINSTVNNAAFGSYLPVNVGLGIHIEEKTATATHSVPDPSINGSLASILFALTLLHRRFRSAS